jgi:D-alanyl-D-alanine carboxypeptidase/D-alanyl-D-alanine-endopeptidase (penicillin-binding protein 4)
MPASNQKILTGATALAQLGPDFTFKTRFGYRGTVRNGVLEGDLVVVGRGDPSFSDAMRGDWRLAFSDMADSVAAHGIREIRGGVRRGGDAFPGNNYGYGWQIDDLRESYGAVVDELFVNEGFWPGGGPIIGPCRGKCAPRPPCRGDCVELGERPIEDPGTSFLWALRTALKAYDITVTDTASEWTAKSAVPDSALTPLFTLVSPPLRTILPVMEKPSQNQIAEIFFKTLGLEKTGVGSADSARRVVERQMLAWGAQPDGFAIRDGSGLSRHDYVTPETIAKVLDAMRTNPNFKVFYDALPIAGVDGTIGARMKGTPAQGNVHAKTGSVDKARSLSGYVTTADGRMLIFSFLCNNFSGSSRDVEKATDALLARIAGSPFPGR